METSNPSFGNPLLAGATLKANLASGGTCIGAFLKIPSPDMVEVLAGAGMEFVIADAEHGPIGPETCQQMARAAEASGVPLLVRIGESGSPGTVLRFLDTGVAGVKLPRVSSPEAAQRQIEAILHPPEGNRGLAAGRWARYGTAVPLRQLVEEFQASFLIVVQIEELEAVARLDELLELRQPDVFFIGPTDLSASMGLRGDNADPHVKELVGETLQRIVASGRTAGILASSPAEASLYLQLGARYLIFNGESIVHWGARLALDACKERLLT
jgi:2-keto-3-deoxy-L-rhamnonate aldolase RhmA